MALDGVEHDDGHGGVLIGLAHGLVGVVEAGLAAHDAALLAGQVDAGLVGEAKLAGILVQAGFAQAVAQRIEEVVAAVGQALDDGLALVLVALTFADPALRRLAFHVGHQHEASLVGDGFINVELALQHRAQGGYHLEDGAGGAAGVDVVVHQDVSAVGEDGAALRPGGDEGV